MKQGSLEEHHGNSWGGDALLPQVGVLELLLSFPPLQCSLVPPCGARSPPRKAAACGGEGSSHSSRSSPLLLASPAAFILAQLCRSQRLPEIKCVGQNVMHGVEQHTLPITHVPCWVKIAAAPGAV